MMLKSVITSIGKIKPLERIRLRQLLARGRPASIDERFYERFEKFDAVIFLKEKNRIRGAATLTKFKFEFKNRSALGILNEQVVLDKTEGNADKHKQKLLGAFTRYLWKQKFKHPFMPLYLFAIKNDHIVSDVWTYWKRAGAEVIELTSFEDIEKISSVVR